MSSPFLLPCRECFDTSKYFLANVYRRRKLWNALNHVDVIGRHTCRPVYAIATYATLPRLFCVDAFVETQAAKF